MRPRISDDVLFATVKEHGKTKAARILDLDVRGVFARIANYEERTGRRVEAPIFRGNKQLPFNPVQHPQRVVLDVEDGIVLIGSDAHYWPGPASPAHRALVKFTRDLEPASVILNGDVMDCATVSRWPRIGWEHRPALIKELETAQERLHEIEMAAPRQARLIWPLGNHDARFETRLASVGPEYEHIKGLHLHDHFSDKWERCWSCWINGEVWVSHRFKGGVHHAYNDTLHAGMTTVTADKHALNVTRFTDLRGTRFGIDTGCMMDPSGPQTRDYSEDNPKNHESGFVVLTFIEGRLMWPEVVWVLDNDHVCFRGQIHDVSEPKAPRAGKVPHAEASRAKAKGTRGRSRGRRAAARRAGRRK